MLQWALENLVLSAILSVAVCAVCRFRSVGPAARHALWLVVLVKMITPSLVTWPWAFANPLAAVEGCRIVQDIPHTVADASDARHVLHETPMPSEVPPSIELPAEDNPPAYNSPPDSELVPTRK